MHWAGAALASALGRRWALPFPPVPWQPHQAVCYSSPPHTHTPRQGPSQGPSPCPSARLPLKPMPALEQACGPFPCCPRQQTSRPRPRRATPSLSAARTSGATCSASPPPPARSTATHSTSSRPEPCPAGAGPAAWSDVNRKPSARERRWLVRRRPGPPLDLLKLSCHCDPGFLERVGQ